MCVYIYLKSCVYGSFQNPLSIWTLSFRFDEGCDFVYCLTGTELLGTKAVSCKSHRIKFLHA